MGKQTLKAGKNWADKRGSEGNNGTTSLLSFRFTIRLS